MIVPLVATALATAAMAVLVRRCPSLQTKRPLPASRTAGRVALVVPARNEEAALPLLLADLRADGWLRPGEPWPSVTVVDDGSSDATAHVATQAGAVVLASATRPAGWNPKVWALSQGADAVATLAETVIFLDADVRLAPGALTAVLDVLAGRGGLVSVAPSHLPRGAVESLSAPCNVIAAAGGGPGLRRDAAGAVGSCMAMRTADYVRAGGHRARPATIVDDLALAATVRDAGLPTTLLRGDRLIGVRSYPDGLRAIVDGWSKNLAAGMGYTQPLVGLAVAAWVASLVLPLALAAQARWLAALSCWLLGGLGCLFLGRQVGRFHPLVVSVGAPVLGVFTTFLTVRSLFARCFARPVRWKGRQLDAAGREIAPASSAFGQASRQAR